jgi:hypothetical protein
LDVDYFGSSFDRVFVGSRELLVGLYGVGTTSAAAATPR